MAGYSFPTGVEDGHQVELENGVTYEFKAEFKRWDVVKGTGNSVWITDELPDEQYTSNGDLWFDNTEDTMQLFLWHEESGAWLPVAPPTTLEDRVAEGEEAQRIIIQQVQAGLAEQVKLQNKVNALEGVLGEHTFVFTTTNRNPRSGEFNLQDGGMNITNSIDTADYIALSNVDASGKDVNLDRIGENDVIRIGSLEGGSAELRITSSTGGLCQFEQVSGDLNRLAEVPHDFVLLSSFDPAGLATIDYVDAQDKALDEKIAAIPAPASSGPAPLLWKHNPMVNEDNLGNGEFRLSINPVSGSADEWTIYFANRDARGQRWFPHDGGNSYSHAVDNQFATIRDRDAIICHGKTKKWYFNQGNNNHAKLILTYYRDQFAMTNDKYYLITIPGYMPFFPYSVDAYSNGTH